MRAIDLAELRSLQLGVLDAIHMYCKENGIKYTLACGTMLGCARHKGYIPWDDDIDIYMLRNDYNELINNFPEIFNGKIKIVSLERDSKWNRPYAKAYDNRTVFSEISECRRPIGVNIDIFPIDKVPDNEDKWRQYNSVRRILQNINTLKVISFTKNRSFAKNLFLLISKTFLLPISSRTIAKCLQNYSKKYNRHEYKRVFENSLGMILKKPFPIALFDELVEMPFEDRNYYAMKHYEIYLESAYGNWQELPPIEKRITHHAFKAYWK